MSKNEKLLKRFISIPKNFRWDELEKLLNFLNFKKVEGAGSRVKFIHVEKDIFLSLHRPHPRPELKLYQVRQILEVLTAGDLI